MVKNSISVVLPAYNEQENIKDQIKSTFSFLKSNFRDFEIIIVDDGSSDKTYDICNKLKGKLEDKVKIIKHECNKGYGAALRSGLFSAEKELVFYTDADNQFNINELLNFVDQIKDYNLVVGYRKNRQDIALRKFCAFVYNRIMRLIFGLRIRDIDCAFKLFKRNSLAKLSIERDNFFVDTELFLKSKLNNFKIKEIGVTHLERQLGQSTVKFHHIFTTLSDVFYFMKKLKLRKRTS